MSNESLHFYPIEPTPFELQFMAQQAAFERELLAAFALTADDIGSLTETNMAQAQRREEMLRKQVRKGESHWKRDR